MQNFASNPKISCNATTDVVMISGFLYFIILAFIVNNILLLVNNMHCQLCLILKVELLLFPEEHHTHR